MTDNKQPGVGTDAPYGTATADALINRYASPHTRTTYECRLCAEMPQRLVVGEVRAHVASKHPTEYALAGERAGTVLVQRAGDFERYAAMPVPDPTYGEFFADAGLTPVEVAGVTIYTCDECDKFAHDTNDDAHRLRNDDLGLMRRHVEKEHPRVVSDEAVRRAGDAWGSLPSDEALISVEGAGVYGCKVCQRDTVAHKPTGDLGEMRAHVLKRHTDEVTEALGGFARSVAHGGTHRTLAEAQRLAREVTGFDPARGRDLAPGELSTPPSRNLLGYRTDDLNGANPYGVSYYDRKYIKPVETAVNDSSFECVACDLLGRDKTRGSLGELRRHLVDEHSQYLTEKAEPGRPAGEFGAMVADALVRENLNGYECTLCVTALTGTSAEALAAMRQHVVIAHSLAYGRLAADALKSPTVEHTTVVERLDPDPRNWRVPSTTSTTHPDQTFEVDRDVLFADDVREAAHRRAGELKICTGVSGESVNVKYLHEKCGGQFDDVHDALAHECAAERLPVTADVLVLKGWLTANESERHRERAAMRSYVNRVGAHATHVREHLDDVFELLAEITAALDRDERNQFDNERERRKRFDRQR